MLSSDKGKTRKGGRKGIRKTAKKNGNADSLGRIKEQISNRLVETEPLPVVKVSD